MAIHNGNFPVGRLVATPGAEEAMRRTGVLWFDLLRRHVNGDWGDLDAEDKQANDSALKTGARLLSAYILPDKSKLWVITEATDDNGHRAATTFLLPEEY